MVGAETCHHRLQPSSENFQPFRGANRYAYVALSITQQSNVTRS